MVSTNSFSCYCRESRPVSMVDLNQGVIDLAVSTIKKTQHGVTMATVPQAMRANLEVSRSVISFPLATTIDITVTFLS